MTRRTMLFALLFALLTSTAPFAATVLTTGTPAEVGLSAETLQEGMALLTKAVDDGELIGGVVLVARHGKVVLLEPFGWRDKENRVPMEIDTLFKMASNVKPVIGTAILQLVEDGVLRLDDPVSKYMPSFDNDRSRTITVRHLLTHTSGFRMRTLFVEPLMQPSDEHPDAPTLQLEIDRVGAVGPALVPRASYEYSNAGFNTLGALIEVISKKPLKQYLHDRVYAPLGMNDTCNFETDADNSRMAKIYDQRRDGGWRLRWSPGDPPQYPFARGSGGMISTASDYARFCQMFINGGSYDDARVLSPDSVREALKPQSKGVYSAVEQATRTVFYGLGWTVYPRTGVLFHSGSDGTYAAADPKNELIVLVLTQSSHTRHNPRNQFFRMIRDACR